jgi:hypothetical protein
MGLFDTPQERDGDLPELQGRVFKLLKVGSRDVTTVYGPTKACDLWVEENGEEKLYSGFSAGISRQIAQANRRDFPCYATIEVVSLKGNKHTTELVMVDPNKPDELPNASDDDIPF